MMLFSERARDVYAQIDFKEPDDFYNREAPDPLVAWIVGGFLSLLTVIYWYIQRWVPVMESIREKQHTHMLNLRVIMSTIADNDDPIFTMLRVSGQSMLFLAGFQLDYALTLTIMVVYYTIISVTDSLRVIFSFNEADSLQDLVEVSKRDRRFHATTLQQMAKNNTTSSFVVDLKTQNVYEDISRSMTTVLLVFLTQSVLISFVVVDAFGLETHTVFDSTKNVPIVGTMGSYLVYVLGIFMQCVYILGPKTNFGTSEQNPHFWLQLLLSAKKNGCRCKWTCEEDGQPYERVLRPCDSNLWIRFIMSFIINGIGFHILVHALPIQVAGQSNLTGIVIRAVGMMYLVDLDDAPGTVLKLMEFENRTETTEAIIAAKKSSKKLLAYNDIGSPPTSPMNGTDKNNNINRSAVMNSQEKQHSSMSSAMKLLSPPMAAAKTEDITSSYSSGASSYDSTTSPTTASKDNSDDTRGKVSFATYNDNSCSPPTDEREDDPPTITMSTTEAVGSPSPSVATTTAGPVLATTANQLIERAKQQAQLIQEQLMRDLQELEASLLLVSSSTTTLPTIPPKTGTDASSVLPTILRANEEDSLLRQSIINNNDNKQRDVTA